MTLQEVFSPVQDERRGPARQHDLHEMIVMAICGVLCGCDGWVDIADWCEDEEKWLKTFLVLRHGTPSHDTFGDVFRVLDGDCQSASNSFQVSASKSFQLVRLI